MDCSLLHSRLCSRLSGLPLVRGISRRRRPRSLFACPPEQNRPFYTQARRNNNNFSHTWKKRTCPERPENVERLTAVNRVISKNQMFQSSWADSFWRTDSSFFIISVTGRTPGGFNRLDIPSSRAYFLGTPTNQNLLPNFIGCIRDFTVDGYEPITNAWARKPDYNIVRRGSMRLCSSSDETR